MDDYDIQEAFADVEEELIGSMMRNFRRHTAEETKEGYEWDMWQVKQLEALETYKRRNKKHFTKRFEYINQQIEKAIKKANMNGMTAQESKLLKAIKDGINLEIAAPELVGEFFRINDRKLDALIGSTIQDMKKAETAVLRMMNDQYRKIIFSAQTYANTVGTYEKAVDMATKDFLTAGINCIQYANGARHTIKDYADMALRTANKRAYLQGEGTMRQKWGIATVIMAKRGNPCPKCLPFVGKVLIDDVWSGGTKEDGPYPLMSTAIAAGLYHPRCKDSHTTYFPGISTADDTWTEEELEKVEKTNKQEAKEQYAKRQEEKYERLCNYSLDENNKQLYKQKRDMFSNARFKTGGMDSKKYAESKRALANFKPLPTNQVIDTLRRESEDWIALLSDKEKEMINLYTGKREEKRPKFYERVNQMLRGLIPKEKSLQENANVISNALLKNRLKHDIVVYRNVDGDFFKNLQVGDKYTDNGFVSTSVTKNGALNKDFELTIFVPKGSKGAYIESLSNYKKQREFLLDKSTKFRVISKSGNSIVVEVL